MAGIFSGTDKCRAERLSQIFLPSLPYCMGLGLSAGCAPVQLVHPARGGAPHCRRLPTWERPAASVGVVLAFDEQDQRDLAIRHDHGVHSQRRPRVPADRASSRMDARALLSAPGHSSCVGRGNNSRQQPKASGHCSSAQSWQGLLTRRCGRLSCWPGECRHDGRSGTGNRACRAPQPCAGTQASSTAKAS